ncbi:glycosyltransferase [Anabaena subtropica FACHB-260]|uniref:Glycosyltransferase n=1 Tax=Anabaena subtropica FACHB-260 TaxID=2692884 RepID=A0ABR8CM56_9NOST|nr:glycosyltransferase [Anabaena subtropica FACHB-260]
MQNILINLNPKNLEMLPVFQAVPNLVILEQPYNTNQKLEFIFGIAQTLKKLQPQAILVQTFGLHIFIGLAARLAGIVSIVTRAGNPAPQEKSIQYKWKLIIQASHFLKIPIHSCSQATHDSLQKLSKLPAGSFAIPNGCDVEAIASQALASRQQRPVNAPITIGMVARLNRIKDQASLIRAFAIVHQKYCNTQLWLIGDGEERNRLQAFTKELGLLESVIFWGNRNDVPSLLGQMDIYAFSTTPDEGFGIAIIEAMAANLPVVASDVPACREVLGNGQAGFLVKSPESLALVIENLINSHDLRNLWGKRAYQYVSEKFSIQNCSKRWYSVLLKQTS